MTTKYTTDLFSTTYKDDFKDSDNYHRVLFNSGRALQARELTQMQTIIQREIERFGRNVFKEGASVNPGGQVLNTRYEFIKLDTSTYSVPTAVNTLALMIGDTFTGQTSGIKVKIIEIVPATATDPATLYVSYIDTLGGTSGDTPIRMTPGETIIGTAANSVALAVQTTDISTNRPTGKGCKISVNQGTFFVQGHFVHVAPQGRILGKYTHTPTATVGFKVSQDVVSASDFQALYDNQGAAPNTSAPGADRYRIRLTLATEDEIASDENFIYFCRVINGVVFDVVGGIDSYNKIEENLARRTKEIQGNFFAKPFTVNYEPDSSATHLQAVVSPGTAYVNGYRANTSFPTRLRIPRAQETIALENDVSAAEYGNYVKVLNKKGQPDISTLARQNLQDAITFGGSTIGTARVRAMEEDGNGWRYYLFDIEMNVGSSFSQVKSIGLSSTQHADLTDVLGQTNGIPAVYEGQHNNLLFDLKYPRHRSLSDISLAVQRRFVTSTDASGNLTITLSAAGETFLSTSEWIVTKNSDGAVMSPSISGAGTQSSVLAFGGAHASSQMTIMAKVNKSNGSLRTKTLTELTVVKPFESDGSGTKFVSLGRPDLYSIDSIRDSAADIGTDMFTSFIVDNGQRDNYYGNARLILKGDKAAPPSGKVYAKFKHFTHGGAGDFFSAQSYVGQVDYGKIPNHTLNDGGVVSLRDVIDFRPRQADSDSNYVGGIINELPDNTDIIQADVSYYLPRLDRIVIDQDGIIRNIEGNPEVDPKFPKISNNEMIIADTRLNAFTINDSDVDLAHAETKMFSMKDIGTLETKLDQLYDITTMSLLEQNLSFLTSLDSTGNDRTKAGFLVDNFKTQQSSDVNNVEYRAAIDPQTNELRPQPEEEAIRLLYDSDLSTGTLLKGDNVYSEYVDSAWITQLQVSGTENINPFAVITHMGHVELSPASDEWRETRYTAANVVGGGTQNRFSGNQATLFNSSQWNWAGTEVGASRSTVIGSSSNTSTSSSTSSRTGTGSAGNWRATATLTTTTSVQTTTSSVTSATARVDSFSTIRSVIGDRVVDVALIPFMRSRTVSFKAQGLKPRTRVFPFFDGVRMDDWVRATTFARVAGRNNELGNTADRASSNPNGVGTLITDAEGNIEGELVIPNTNALRFRTGTREFKLLDISVNNEEDATAIGVAVFTSSGVLETRQQTIQSTRVRNVVTGTSTSSSSSSRVTGRSNSWATTNRNIATGEFRVNGVVVTPPRTVRQIDPLAQSFFVPEQDGVFVTKVDIYFKTKDDVIPVQMQIRPLVNGHPSSEDVVPGSIVFKSPAAINVSEDASVASTFVFEEPVYLLPYQEYAIVLIAESDEYNVYVAEGGEFILNSTEKRITGQPSLGSLFKSQNATTWNADQTKDMMFVLHRAKFTVGNATAVLENASLPQRLLEPDPILTTANDDRIVVQHKSHGMKPNDPVYIYGFDSGLSYDGVSGSNLNGLKIIESSDADNFSYRTGDSATAGVSIGGFGISTTQNYPFETVYPYIETLIPQGTSLALNGKFLSGRSIAGSETMYIKDPDASQLALRAHNYYTNPKVLANDHLQGHNLPAGTKSATIEVNMEVTSDFVSPVLDMQRASLWLTHNRIDNQASSAAGGFNVPLNYVPETDKNSGTSIAKHITRPVTLQTAAVGLKAILSANKPSVASFNVYYKAITADEEFGDTDWTIVAPENILPADDNPAVFRDYEYLVGGVGGLTVPFSKFQLKIVMRSSNNAKPPKFKDLRVIALVT